MSALLFWLGCVAEPTLHAVDGAPPTPPGEAPPAAPPEREDVPPIGLGDGTFEELADAPRLDGTERDGSAVFYEEGVIRRIDLALDEDAVRSLTAAPKVDVHATFRFEGGDPWDVGLHLKGTSSFRTLAEKPAFKIDFHEWDAGQRFMGVKRLTLNNMAQDPTMLREHLYYWTCQQLGLPAPRHGYAHVFVNDEDFGLYGVVETYDEQLVDRWWPQDDAGPLYEGSGNDFTRERQDFELEEEGVGPTIQDLVRIVIDTPDDQFLAMLEANFDVDALLGYWALDIVSGNPDGYAYNHNNFYVYGAPLAARWTMLPAGTDRAFSFPDAGIHGSEKREMRAVLPTRCIAHPECHARLDARIRETADAFDTLDLVGVASRMLEYVEPACEADPRRDRDCRSPEILDFLDERGEQVREELDEE